MSLLLNFMVAQLLVWYWRDNDEGVIAHALARHLGGRPWVCVLFTNVFKGKRLRKTEKNIVGIEEEYVHPTLRTTLRVSG